ncbi:MAG: hypothetical protein IKC72_03990 [Clostridia bacterium]|nr:hypothetical protein [Clostridia bacterium]
MKKILLFLAMIVLSLSLVLMCSCDDKDKDGDKGNDGSASIVPGTDGPIELPIIPYG